MTSEALLSWLKLPESEASPADASARAARTRVERGGSTEVDLGLEADTR
jgi:hypothetical protein